MIDISDIYKLEDISYPIENDNNVLILRKNEFDSILSYKSKAKQLSSLYDTAAALKALEDRMNSVYSKMAALSAKFIAIEKTKSKYALESTLENDRPALLTYDNMESLISRYATDENMEDYAAQARKEANRLADEMTDFAAAAMVGINQSGAGAAAGAVVPAGGSGEGGGDSGGSGYKTVNEAPDNSGHIVVGYSSDVGVLHNKYDGYIYKFNRAVQIDKFEWYRTNQKF